MAANFVEQEELFPNEEQEVVQQQQEIGRAHV